jgi:AcrR family transcriptional regulator
MPRRAKLRPDEPGHGRILKSGLELFGERGYDAVSIAEIGERAGIAKSVLYHHFGSKAGLFEAVAESETAALVECVEQAVETSAGPPVRTGVEAYLAFLQENPAAWRLLLRDPPADPELAQVHERLAAERAAALAGLLAGRGGKAADTAHLGLVSVAIRAFAAWWYDNRQVPAGDVAEAIMDVVEAGARRLNQS